jgi:hypothetical protein
MPNAAGSDTVDRFRAIQGDAEKPVVLAEQRAPIVVQKDPVGLKSVADLLSPAPVLLLEFNEFLEEGQAREGRLSALKDEATLGIGIEQVAVNQPFQRVERHATRGQFFVRVGVAVQVKTVSAIQIADGRNGLDQHERYRWSHAGCGYVLSVDWEETALV